MNIVMDHHPLPTPPRSKPLIIAAALIAALGLLPWGLAELSLLTLRAPGFGADLGYRAAHWAFERRAWGALLGGWGLAVFALGLWSPSRYLFLYRARVFTQIASITLFLGLLWFTRLPEQTGDAPVASTEQSLQMPMQGQAFLDFDPLIGAATWMSAHHLPEELWWGLLLVLLTVLLGRVFCGWLCPFGIMHNFIGWLRMKFKLTSRQDPGKPSVWQEAKYGVLVVILVSSLFGLQLVGWLDPIALATRSVALVVLPMLQYLMEALARFVPEISLSALTGGPNDTLASWILDHRPVIKQPTYENTFIVGAIFFGLLFLNFVRLRFWCRYICPLGAFLGVLARFSLQRIAISRPACTSCHLCSAICEGAADPEYRYQGWNKSECFYCYSCVDECPTNALAAQFPQRIHHEGTKDTKAGPETPQMTRMAANGGSADALQPQAALGAPRSALGKASLDPQAPLSAHLDRRRFLFSVVGGALLTPLFRLGFDPRRAQGPKLIRPPGSVGEENFLARCIRCAECMKVCPTNALHPAGLEEGGLESLWTPVFKMRRGACAYNCTLCAQVCPTDAIENLPLSVKQQVKVGVAHVNLGKCLPYSYDTECIVCEEFCPTAPKAIRAMRRYDEADTRLIETIHTEKRIEKGRIVLEHREGESIEAGKAALVYPVVLDAVCIGCGWCEYVCPVRDDAAIVVTSVNESRALPDGNRLGIS